MSSGQRWIVGEPTNGEKNEADIGIDKPLLQRTEIPKNTPFLRMLFYGSIVAAPYIVGGMNMGFSSIALPQMDVNIDEASWFGSLQPFGSMIGALAIGFIMDKYGRRPSFILAIFPCIIGWILLATSTNINFKYLGQFLAGIMSGCIYIGQVYAAESIVVNHTHLRNSFNVWSSIASSIGLLLDAALGRLLPYRTVAFIAAVIAITSLICICIFIPESPHWLYQRGLIHRARLSEQQLYIHQPILKDFQQTPASVIFDTRFPWQSIMNGLQKLRRKDVYKPLIILNVWFIFVVFSGSGCVGAYQVSILNDYPVITDPSDITWYGGTSRDHLLRSYNKSIISAVLNLVAIILASTLVTYTGIKTLFNFSAIGICVSMAGLAMSLGVSEEYQVTAFWQLAHTVLIWLIAFFDCLGVTTIPTSLIGEMLPYDAKGFASIPFISYCGIGGIVTKMHLYLYSYLGYFLYFIYAFFNIVSITFVMIFVPETVGKTQEEIGECFIKGQ